MGTQRARFERWFKRWRGPRTPEEEAAVLRFADAFDAAEESGQLSREQLTLVVDAAGSKRALLWMNATELLAKLAIRWEAAADAVGLMFQSRQAHVRFNALCCLRADSPTRLLDGLLRSGLIDKSFRVRWKAAEKVGRFERKDLLPDLEAAFVRETNSTARAAIELDLRLLRDGYIMKPASLSSFSVTVRTRDGILSAYFGKAEVDEKGISAIAAELRSR